MLRIAVKITQTQTTLDALQHTAPQSPSNKSLSSVVRRQTTTTTIINSISSDYPSMKFFYIYIADYHNQVLRVFFIFIMSKHIQFTFLRQHYVALRMFFDKDDKVKITSLEYIDYKIVCVKGKQTNMNKYE